MFVTWNSWDYNSKGVIEAFTSSGFKIQAHIETLYRMKICLVMDLTIQ